MARDFSGDRPDDGGAHEHVAEVPTRVGETRRIMEAVGTVLDGRAGGSGTREGGRDAPELLGAIGDGLIEAYRFAKEDGDPLTLVLIEKALLHVGRRLASGLTPADVGLVCH